MPSSSLVITPWVSLILLAICYVLATTGISVSSYSIPAASMIPTLAPGERIFASKHYYQSAGPVAGDVVIFHSQWHGAFTTFIKRVVAGPGDRVAMQGGRLIINGAMVERLLLPPLEPMGGSSATTQHYRETLPNGRSYEIAEIGDGEMLDEIAEVLVEPGHYFVLGDYRDRSNDSRNPEFGTIGAEMIDDKASIIWLSSDWRRLGAKLQPAP